MRRLALSTLAAALTAGTALANAPPAPNDPPQVWSMPDGETMVLAFGGDGIQIACPEAKKELRISIAPAWEVGYGKPDGTVFEGPTDKVTVSFGDKNFEAVQDASLKDEVVYVMPADADSVTAIMLATNATVALASDPQQTREGVADETGNFDMFATTCAQINGLK